MSPASDVARTVDTIWRMEAPRIIAALARMLRDVGLAEEFAQDACLRALEEWPAAGIPERPGAWLMTTARHRAIDRLRHERMLTRRNPLLVAEAEESTDDADSLDPAAIADDLLRLIFVACHPVLATEARVALTLRLLGGLAPAEIARAFLTTESAIQQRIVRAKRSLRAAHVPFEVPAPAERAARLASVLEVIYLIFNEGYTATAGEDWMRPALCEEALRLARVLSALAPAEAEVHGLLALLEIQASRLAARVDAQGEPIRLLEQNRARWDPLLIRRGLDALARAEALAGSLGPYTLQAAIAACHARALQPAATDWPRIVALYDALAQLAPSPIIELNRAVAVSMAYGAGPALEIVEGLCADERLRDYHLLPSVRGDLLEKLGRHAAASAAFAQAARLTANVRERALLLERMRRCEALAAATTPRTES